MYIIPRLLALPFFAILALIALFIMWLRYCRNYILYGGEAIAYTKKMQRKAIADVFEKLQEKLQKDIVPKTNNHCRDCKNPIEEDNVYGQCVDCYFLSKK